jgi:hypothetical protein
MQFNESCMLYGRATQEARVLDVAVFELTSVGSYKVPIIIKRFLMEMLSFECISWL